VDRQNQPPLCVGESSDRIEGGPDASVRSLLALAVEQGAHSLNVVERDRARVVHEDVGRPELAGYLRECRADGFAVADVGFDGEPAADGLYRAPRSRGGHVENRNVGAGLGEANADRRSDTRSTARDHGHLALEGHRASITA
jgi:hypothetical protein